jgi:hypothetical protein
LRGLSVQRCASLPDQLADHRLGELSIHQGSRPRVVPRCQAKDRLAAGVVVVILGSRRQRLDGCFVASVTVGEPERGPVADVVVGISAELAQGGEGRLVEAKRWKGPGHVESHADIGVGGMCDDARPRPFVPSVAERSNERLERARIFFTGESWDQGLNDRGRQITFSLQEKPKAVGAKRPGQGIAVHQEADALGQRHLGIRSDPLPD